MDGPEPEQPESSNLVRFLDQRAPELACAALGDEAGATLVVLAGFMRILTPGFVTRYAGRLLNIHPSLLPAFPGLDTHRRAIEAGCRVAGVTGLAIHLPVPPLRFGTSGS